MNDRWAAAFFGFVATVLVNSLGIFLFVKVVDWSSGADLSLSWRNSGLLALVYITLRFWNTALFRVASRGRPAESSEWGYSRRAPMPPR